MILSVIISLLPCLQQHICLVQISEVKSLSQNICKNLPWHVLENACWIYCFIFILIDLHGHQWCVREGISGERRTWACLLCGMEEASLQGEVETINKGWWGDGKSWDPDPMNIEAGDTSMKMGRREKTRVQRGSTCRYRETMVDGDFPWGSQVSLWSKKQTVEKKAGRGQDFEKIWSSSELCMWGIWPTHVKRLPECSKDTPKVRDDKFIVLPIYRVGTSTGTAPQLSSSHHSDLSNITFLERLSRITP